MDTFVKLENITKIYHMGEVEIRAVDGIDFSIQKGEFVVIVGPSGAGKTTVLNILGGMDTASGGRITVDGQDITKYSERQLTGYRRDDIGFVFQFYNLIPNLTALENVEMALQICRNPLDARAVLKEVRLINAATKKNKTGNTLPMARIRSAFSPYPLYSVRSSLSFTYHFPCSRLVFCCSICCWS